LKVKEKEEEEMDIFENKRFKLFLFFSSPIFLIGKG